MKRDKGSWFEPEGEVFNKGFLNFFKKFFPHSGTIKQVDFIEKVLKLNKKMKILDLACGWGRHAIELGKRGYKVTGLDLNPLYLKVAKKESTKLKLTIDWVEGDIRKLPFKDDSFDVVYCLSNSFGYFQKEKEHQEVIKEVARVLKPKGRFLLDFLPLEALAFNFQKERKKEIGENCLLIIKASFDFLKSRCYFEGTIIQGGKKRTINYDIRMFTIREILTLCQKFNLKFKKLYGFYSQKPFDFSSQRAILIVQKIN